MIAKEEISEFEIAIESLLCYATVWSFEYTTNFEGRKKFDLNIRELLHGYIGLPSLDGLVHDFWYDLKNKWWTDWYETIPAYHVDTRANYTDIVVLTFDLIRIKYIKKFLISNKKHVLFPGGTGTGKTVNIEELLKNEMPEKILIIIITFSAHTSANQTQNALDEKFEKRARGIFGPTSAKNSLYSSTI